MTTVLINLICLIHFDNISRKHREYLRRHQTSISTIPQYLHVKNLHEGLFSPSANSSVLTFSAFSTLPCATFLLRFSAFIHKPSQSTKQIHVPLQHAVAIRVGIYFGANSVLNVAPLSIPPKLLNPTSKPVVAAREFSLRLLLLCQLWTRQDGM